MFTKPRPEVDEIGMHCLFPCCETVKSSRSMYDAKLNWDAWGTEMNKIMTRLTIGLGT